MAAGTRAQVSTPRAAASHGGKGSHPAPGSGPSLSAEQQQLDLAAKTLERAARLVTKDPKSFERCLRLSEAHRSLARLYADLHGKENTKKQRKNPRRRRQQRRRAREADEPASGGPLKHNVVGGTIAPAHAPAPARRRPSGEVSGGPVLQPTASPAGDEGAAAGTSVSRRLAYPVGRQGVTTTGTLVDRPATPPPQPRPTLWDGRVRPPPRTPPTSNKRQPSSPDASPEGKHYKKPHVTSVAPLPEPTSTSSDVSMPAVADTEPSSREEPTNQSTTPCDNHPRETSLGQGVAATNAEPAL